MAQKKTTTNLGNEEKKALIEHDSKVLTIKHQCRLLNLPRSTAYHQSKPTEPSDDEVSIKNAIDRIHFFEPSYGVRRILKELKKLGYAKVGKRRIRRYMQEMCITAFYPGPNLSKRDLAERTYPYLLRNVKPNRVNQVWGIDITYCGLPNGFLYLVAIIDWYSRYIVGWAISNTISADFVKQTVQEAITVHGKPEIINSDQGSQFTSKAYIDCIKGYETIKNSMDGKGRATDNAITERFFRSFKWERLYLECPETVKELKDLTKNYIEHYNYSRPHQALDYRTPADYFHRTDAELAAA